MTGTTSTRRVLPRRVVNRERPRDPVGVVRRELPDVGHLIVGVLPLLISAHAVPRRGGNEIGHRDPSTR